mmetsp:Transcript_32602/g.85345  ORF Transcript_32602/g.85345 Transcript_32602/m.85345 type:complete len:202 (+) Transcript_32602:4106-4711(+)
MPITFSVCGSQAIQQGFEVYLQARNISTGNAYLQPYFNVGFGVSPLACTLRNGDAITSGLVISGTTGLTWDEFYIAIPSSFVVPDFGYNFTIACSGAEVTDGSLPHTNHGWSSLSSGDQTAVIVGIVSTICIIGAVVAAIFTIKRYKAKIAYQAATLVRELPDDDGGNDDDDERMLQLHAENETYEDEFNEDGSPQTYGEN